MAKLAFSKLGLKLNKDIVELHISDEITILFFENEQIYNRMNVGFELYYINI